MYAPTTIAPARDFWTLRYTTTLEDGSLAVSSSSNLKQETFTFFFFNLENPFRVMMIQVCERSLSGSGAGPCSSTAHQFVRAEMLPSGFLIRPCDGGSSIVHIVDHLDLEVPIFPSLCSFYLCYLFV